MIGSLHIDTGALRHNARALAALVAPSKTAFVVKSNAYGHGLVETALAIEPLSSALCVYSVEEAVALREGGVPARIIVLGPVPFDAIDTAIAETIEFALWDAHDFMRHAINAATKRGARARVHAKINTGLNRLGIEAEDLADAAEDIARASEIDVVGVFSHLASAEEIDSPYTTYQLDRFTRAFNAAEPTFAASAARPQRHIAASAAAMLWPQTRLDMTRIGIALYGLWPSAQTKEAMNGNAIELKPALSYRSELVVAREVAAGAAVGYGCTYHAPRTMRIGVVPLGYADGIPRQLSNVGAFVVDGARAPIVGRVAMNMTVVDLTHAPQARVGSVVTLIGEDGAASVTADDWATWAGTINYEIVTRLPSEISRIYDT